MPEADLVARRVPPNQALGEVHVGPFECPCGRSTMSCLEHHGQHHLEHRMNIACVYAQDRKVLRGEHRPLRAGLLRRAESLEWVLLEQPATRPISYRRRPVED